MNKDLNQVASRYQTTYLKINNAQGSFGPMTKPETTPPSWFLQQVPQTISQMSSAPSCQCQTRAKRSMEHCVRLTGTIEWNAVVVCCAGVLSVLRATERAARLTAPPTSPFLVDTASTPSVCCLEIPV